MQRIPTKKPTVQKPCIDRASPEFSGLHNNQSVPDGERPVVHIAVVCGFNRKFYKQRNSQQSICDMQFTVVANESNRELRCQGASGWTPPVFVLSLIF